MIIRDMFEKDINRQINGVIKVDQDEKDVIHQEVEEYVITQELKKHFKNFFDYYSKSFKASTSDTGIWISGFFGSGKSHFLKILSYILENRSIDGIPTVEFFSKKLEDDPETFNMIKSSTRNKTETILFNIDIEGAVTKDKTAVLRVFAKMFYNHLGYFGENLKTVMMEKYIESQGKTEEFRRVFEKKKKQPWLEQRKAFAFNGKFIISTLMEVLDMNEKEATQWFFNDKSYENFSIGDLVNDIKEYVNKKPPGFRLIFMADEVGQYVGTDTNMLLNLQSLTEKIGSECSGKVWIACTGQDAIDEIIKVRTNEFSRIQARFRTRLSLSSSSVDEVIQKRILKKTAAAAKELKKVYSSNDAALRNLFAFENAVGDIRGYREPEEFIANYPFVPYQFIILQKVFYEIRRHGNSGKHLSGGERSMLSGFKEAAVRLQERNTNALAPFFYFYNTVHSFLDSSIRRVIERCEKAAEENAGLELFDVDVLKLLYLVCYVKDIPTKLDNVVIMMADDIRTNKIDLRSKVQASLDRLLDQNYISKEGETYKFLTDEEQDVAREIKDTKVDIATVLKNIGETIFEDIYPSKKYRYKNNADFPYGQLIDDQPHGELKGDMRLRFLTVATSEEEKSNLRLMNTADEVVVVLADTPYYELMEKAAKIRKYCKNNIQIQGDKGEIIKKQQNIADNHEKDAKEALKKAIEAGVFYVNGEQKEIKGSDAKSKIDQALGQLVVSVYSKLNFITKNAEKEEDITAILKGYATTLDGTEANTEAIEEMEAYLADQHDQNRNTSMADIQSRYQARPYGWREIDIAAVAAQLIYDQKVTIKYSGDTVQPSDSNLPDMLRKKTEVGKTWISKRIVVSSKKIKEVKAFLREYFDITDIPDDEDGLIATIKSKFENQLAHYERLINNYNEHEYPDKLLVTGVITLLEEIQRQGNDNIALIGRILDKQEDLKESKNKMQRVEGFFKSQKGIFDDAVKLESRLRNDLDYLAKEHEANDALDTIRLICIVSIKNNSFDYDRIPELNDLMNTVKSGHNKLLEEKREAMREYKCQCLGAIRSAAYCKPDIKDILKDADAFYEEREKKIAELESIALLDALSGSMVAYKDSAIKKIAAHGSERDLKRNSEDGEDKKVYRPCIRSIIFPERRLGSKDDIEKYVREVHKVLMELFEDCDGIDLK